MTIALAQAQPGDLVACHSKGAVGFGIRLAERFRRDWKQVDRLSSESPGDEWNHWAILGTVSGPAELASSWTVIQAEGRGVTDTSSLDDIAPGGHFEIAQLPPEADRHHVLEFAQAQVGSRYGFLTIVSILVTLLSPRFLNVMLPGTWICSAVTAESLRCGGWIRNWGDLYSVSPAELWCALA